MATTVGFVRVIGVLSDVVFVPDMEAVLERKFSFIAKLEEKVSFVSWLEEKFSFVSWLEKKFNIKGILKK